MMSVFLHAAILALLLFGPRLPFIKEYLAQQAELQQQEVAEGSSSWRCSSNSSSARASCSCSRGST